MLKIRIYYLYKKYKDVIFYLYKVCGGNDKMASGKESGGQDGLAWEVASEQRPGHEQRHLAGYSPWGSKGVGHDLVTEQQTIAKEWGSEPWGIWGRVFWAEVGTCQVGTARRPVWLEG